MDLNAWFTNNWWWFVILWIWSLIWKIFALWRAAHKEDKAWFVALMILNTAGLLEIFYLFVFSQRQYRKLSEKSEKEEVKK
jgi:membrane protein YdbS with pleckstrin-like domain